MSKTNNTADQEITQLEYALYQNPHVPKLKYKQLNYDISLLNCATTDPSITDFNATPEMHAKKQELCPGYVGGVAVTFSADEDGKICPPIYCDGKNKCFMIYTFDRTRLQESSFTCTEEYKGDLTLDLCVGNGDAK